MLRPFPINNPIIAQQSRRRKRKLGWLVIIAILAGINGYLFLSNNLSSAHIENQTLSSNKPQQQQLSLHSNPSSQLPCFENRLGEIQGVAGIRTIHEEGLNLASVTSNLRFDLKKAQSIAGVRALQQWCQRITGTIKKSDTFTTALERCGIDSLQISFLVNALNNVLDFRTIRAGEEFELWLSPTDNIERFVYRQTSLVSYLVEHTSGELLGRKISRKTQTKLTSLSVRIQDSLYTSLSRAGESPTLVMMLVDIFAWDIDFYIDTHTGDTIRLLVEKEELDGEFVQYGLILAAEYQGDIGTHRAFRYKTLAGEVGYYDAQGNSLRKTFLKSPLKFTNVSSGYGTRVHPILGFSKMHLGIDLAAPIGTPIWAPADGLVAFAGRKGISGKLVVLRHANGYETIFAHLHNITRDVQKGHRIKQMQLLGSVGSTGLSTGPHLHYGMKKNGIHVNPFQQRFPPTNPVPKQEHTKYKSKIAPLLDKLENIPFPSEDCTASIPSEKKETG